MQITVAMRTRPLIVVAIKTWPQRLTQSIAGNERNFDSALLHTNEISKHSTKLRLKIRFTKRNIFRNFARCFAQSGEISNMSRQ